MESSVNTSNKFLHTKSLSNKQDQTQDYPLNSCPVTKQLCVSCRNRFNTKVNYKNDYGLTTSSNGRNLY